MRKQRARCRGARLCVPAGLSMPYDVRNGTDMGSLTESKVRDAEMVQDPAVCERKDRNDSVAFSLET